MPTVSKLSVHSFRNLHSVEIAPSEGTNLIFGSNGSGKTSLLESISVLAHGRSFRTHKYRNLVKEDSDKFVLFCEVLEAQDSKSKIGVERNKTGDIQIRIDGKAEYSSASLAQKIPLLVLTSLSFQILDGGSKQRRQFLDWLVFHVKPEFREAWRDYSKCIKQRNSLLRRGNISSAEIAPWDAKIAATAANIEDLRSQVFILFEAEFQRVTTLFNFNTKQEIVGRTDDDKALAISYISGWKTDNDFTIQLSDSLPRDLKIGYTTIGSHKSDLKICFNKYSAAERLSRGQQKSVILSMFIAAARCYKQITGKNPVVLLDDLPAELDETNLKIVSHELERLGFQLFITAIDKDAITRLWVNPIKTMFHVEHGNVNHGHFTKNQETDSNYE